MASTPAVAAASSEAAATAVELPAQRIRLLKRRGGLALFVRAALGDVGAGPLPRPLPPEPCAVVSPDGRRLYVISRSAAMVTMFTIASDGALTTPGTSVPVLGENPRWIAMTPEARFQDDGTLTRLGTTPIGAAGGAMALTPDGRFLFVPCSASHDVFVFRVGSDGGLTPVPDSPFPAPDIPIAAAVTPDGRNLYVTDGGLVKSKSKLVSAYTIRDNGSLDHIADVHAGKSPVALAPTPDGRWLYVSNIDSSNVSAFRIEPGGELKEFGDSLFRTRGERPAFQPIAVLPNQGPQAALSVGETTGLVARFDASAAPGAIALNSRTLMTLDLRLGTATFDDANAGISASVEMAVPRSGFFGSRAFPQCLAASDGAWQVWWKLGWAAVCPIHRVLLVDCCPSCCSAWRSSMPLRSLGRHPLARILR